MAQLKNATDELRSRIEDVITANRKSISTSIEGRRTELVASAYYEKATAAAQQGVFQLIDQTLSRVAAENQVALILQFGTDFEASVYPSLLDQLAASQQGGGNGPPPKQTVAVKSVVVPAVSGVLETEDDVDKYLAALRAALLQTLDDGKRISL
jgi:hypothetical protein